MKDLIYSWIVGVIMVVTFFFFCYGVYTIAKRVNYSLAYKDMVRETVREMVTDEALKQ